MFTQSLKIAALMAVVASASVASAAAADQKPLRIALSNSFAGNSWRRAMLQSWDTAAKQALAVGLVAEAPVQTTDDNETWEQADQIRAMTRDGYDAIVIDAASPTALNDAVAEACAAGIVVVSFDNVVSEPCAYRVGVDFAKLGAMQVDYFRGRGLSGNILEVRGIPGATVNDAIHDGIHAEIRTQTALHIVASVHGDWTEDVAKRAVSSLVPYLPVIAAVTTQGGDGVGVAQAFTQAGRAPPVIFLGNRDDELTWWKQQHDATGYETMSASIAPGCASFAFWLTQSILRGTRVPHDITLPLTVVTQATLDDARAHTPADGVTSTDFTRADVAAFLGKPTP